MIAASTVRPILVGAQIVATFAAANVAGVVAAVNYQNQQVQQAKASIDAASVAFDAQVKRSLDDGTPLAAIDPLVQQETALKSQALPPAAFIIDRQQLAAIQKRADDVKALSGQVKNAEDQAASQVHERLVQALLGLAADIKPAAAAGVDTAEFQKFVDETTAANQAVSTPKAGQSAVDAVTAKDGELKAATASRVAANQALAAAQADAHNAVNSAQAALAKVQAIPVLKVGDVPTTIAALVDRLSHAAALADFQDIAAKAWAQSSALNTILSTRQSAYDLAATTRTELGMAQAAGKDVAQDAANLDTAVRQLDAASDLPTLQAAKAAIQAVKSVVDAKYWQAIYGAGKVIVVSIQRQELVALENGAVKVDTLVTTGRPALPTITGVYHIFRKESPYQMRSDWPRGSPYYFDPVWMSWAMEWESSGYFIHDAPWRSRYGPGTNNDNGTHGCINVPHDPMSVLYSWAEIGTTVVVLKGDFGSSP
ncbi:MAG: L,D-transpeptidase [Candidatus Dormibacteraeota bacterium]|nr:L,D-transpeptidase [Candidatus Dormibacteraeota bacterium]